MDTARAVEELYTVGHWLLTQGRPRDAAAVLRAMVLAAPADERGWLGLGACHEAIDQMHVAREMYGIGRSLAAPSVRCELALAHVLRELGEEDGASEAMARAHEIAVDPAEVHALLEGEGR